MTGVGTATHETGHDEVFIHDRLNIALPPT